LLPFIEHEIVIHWRKQGTESIINPFGMSFSGQF